MQNFKNSKNSLKFVKGMCKFITLNKQIRDRVKENR